MRKSGIIYPDSKNTSSIFGGVVIDEEIDFFEIAGNLDAKKSAPELTQKVDSEEEISILKVPGGGIDAFQSQSKTVIQTMDSDDKSIFSVSQDDSKRGGDFQYKSSTWGMYQSYSQRKTPETKIKFGFGKVTKEQDRESKKDGLIVRSQPEKIQGWKNDVKEYGLKKEEFIPSESSKDIKTKRRKKNKKLPVESKSTTVDKEKIIKQFKNNESKKKKEFGEKALGPLFIFEIFNWLLGTDIIVRLIIGLIAGVVGFLLIFTRLGLLGYF